jgi:hypothetical protein
MHINFSPSSAIPDLRSLLSTPTKQLAKLVLEHVSFTDELSPGSPTKNTERLLEAARRHDVKWELSPSQTVVNPKQIFRSGVYTHTNPESYKNEIVAEDRKNADMLAAHRIFLDCFVGNVGLSHITSVSQVFALLIFANFALEPGAWEEGRELTTAEKKRFQKWGSVMHKMPEIPGMMQFIWLDVLQVAVRSTTHIIRWVYVVSLYNSRGYAKM